MSGAVSTALGAFGVEWHWEALSPRLCEQHAATLNYWGVLRPRDRSLSGLTAESFERLLLGCLYEAWRSDDELSWRFAERLVEEFPALAVLFRERYVIAPEMPVRPWLLAGP